MPQTTNNYQSEVIWRVINCKKQQRKPKQICKTCFVLEEYLIDKEEMALRQVKPSQNTSYLIIPVDVNSFQLTKASKHAVPKYWVRKLWY